MTYVLLLPLAYLIGAIPSGLIIGRLWRGVDVRQYGSGSTGMTNVLRTLGWRAALLVFALDGLKGAAAVLLARYVLVGTSLAESLAILAAIVGHIWPVFAHFRGGRGIATGVAGLLTMSPLAGLVALAAFAPVLALTRYVSLSSITGVAAGAIVLVLLVALHAEPVEYLIYALAGGTLLIWSHRANIRRLLQGKELRLGQKTTPVGQAQAGGR